MDIDRAQLQLLPGNEEWLYYKLYGCSKRQDELILAAYDVLDKLTAEGIAQKYFFIRYSDPEPHMRLRIKPGCKGMLTLVSSTSLWLNNLNACGLMSKAVNDTYTREAERYGGPELIKYAEDYFCSDSKLVTQLLSHSRYGKLLPFMDYIGVSFIISTLEAFGLSTVEQQVLLSSMVDKKSYKKEYQNNRGMFISAVDSIDDWFGIRSFISSPEVYDLINANAQELKKYTEAIYAFDKEGLLTNSIREICLSVIHMFCNRLMGNNIWERKIYTLASHGVYGFIGRSKHKKNKSLDLILPESLF